ATDALHCELLVKALHLDKDCENFSFAACKVSDREDAAATDLMSDRIVGMVFQAMQTQLTVHMQAQEEGLLVVLTHVVHLEQTVHQLKQVVHRQEQGYLQQVLHVLKINLPEVYNGKSKQPVDQFAEQVKAVAEFEVFRSDQQKIIWAQSYFTGSAYQ
ncbi:hypothetical protein C0989_006453, partial [Termitomyces sp. Mn162]